MKSAGRTLIPLFLFILFTGVADQVFAQYYREPEEKVLADLMERWIENSDADIDYTDLQDQLEFYLRNKIDLNKATREELQRLPMLDDPGIEAILRHRQLFGSFISIYELQSIEALDERTIYYLSYFAAVEESQGSQLSVMQMLSKGKHEVIALHENRFQRAAGYDPAREANGQTHYLGSPYRYLLRYRFNYGSHLSYGYTGEKDMGEQFFKGAQKQGFDFQSVHFVLRNRGRFKTIALGDYQANFGQGLTFGSGLAAGKSADVLRVRRNFQTIRPYRSVNENEFMRGVAVTYRLHALELTGMYSSQRISTNFRALDSLPGADVFTSVQLTGLHRTPAEILNRNNVRQTICGAHAKWRSSNYDVGLTGVYTQYDHRFMHGDKPYQLYQFSGKHLSNFGADYNFYIANVNFFGELSASSNGGYAGIAGIALPLHQKADLVMAYRNFAKNYQSTFTSPFSEYRDARNEEGYYTGLSLKPAPHWVFNTYFDLYRAQWLRYLTDGPSHGYDWLGELQYNPTKSTQVYLRYRHEVKQGNIPNNDAARTDELAALSKENIRFHAQYKITPSLSGKTRAEFVQYHDMLNGYQSGTLIFQDLQYTTPFKDFSVTGRVALFAVEDARARVYATESDVLYHYAVPQYAHNGLRYYVLVHYRVTRQLDVWARYAQTTYSDVQTIGSGTELVQGNVLSDLRVQARLSF